MNPHLDMPGVTSGESAEERRDSYLRHSELLVDADNAEDPVELMLIVCRLLLSEITLRVVQSGCVTCVLLRSLVSSWTFCLLLRRPLLCLLWHPLVFR